MSQIPVRSCSLCQLARDDRRRALPAECVEFDPDIRVKLDTLNRQDVSHGQAGWPAGQSDGRLSDGANLRGLRTLRPLGHAVLDLLVLFESAVPARIDRGEVDENVRAPVVRGDETKALVRVEPLYGPLSHFAVCPSRCSVIRTSRASA